MTENDKLKGYVQDALRNILKNKGINVTDDMDFEFDVKKISKGSKVRTNAYSISVSQPQELEGLELFCKEYTREGSFIDLAGRRRLEVDEGRFSEMLQLAGGFTPAYLTRISFQREVDGRSKLFSMSFNENYSQTLEGKLNELYERKQVALDSNDEQSVQLIEEEAGDWIRRFADIIMVNNRLLNTKFREEEVIGTRDNPKVRHFNPVNFADDLRTYFDVFVKAMIPESDKRREWEIKFRYDRILSMFIEDVANYMDDITDKSQATLLGPYPGHCVYKDSVRLANPPYDDARSIFEVRDGTKKGQETPYNGFGICDLSKIGTYHPLIGLSGLFTSPAITRLLPPESIKPFIQDRKKGLLDHIMVTELKMNQGDNQSVFLEDITPENQREFLEKYSRASLWSLLRPLYFVSSLTPEEQKDLSQRRPVYNPDEFAKNCVQGVLDIYDPAGIFTPLKNAFEDLYKILDKNPFAKRIQDLSQ